MLVCAAAAVCRVSVSVLEFIMISAVRLLCWCVVTCGACAGAVVVSVCVVDCGAGVAR